MIKSWRLFAFAAQSALYHLKQVIVNLFQPNLDRPRLMRGSTKAVLSINHPLINDLRSKENVSTKDFHPADFPDSDLRRHRLRPGAANSRPG
jgi:hypothetical protein